MRFSPRPLAVGFSTVYGIVICYPLVASAPVHTLQFLVGNSEKYRKVSQTAPGLKNTV